MRVHRTARDLRGPPLAHFLCDTRLHPAKRLWLTWAESLERWHRYSVSGLEHLDAPGSKILLGYHGRLFAHDLIILNGVLFRRHGDIPVSIFHTYFQETPALRWFLEGIDGSVADSASMRRAIAQGRHIVLLPGGNREANRPIWVRHQVDWGKRLGYLRFALRYRLPLVPVAAYGVDHTIVGLHDGYRLGKLLKRPHNQPFWVAFGLTGPIPFTLNFPARFRQVIGPPIELELDPALDPRDRECPKTREALLEMHERVTTIMQATLDEAREAHRAEGWRKYLRRRV